MKEIIRRLPAIILSLFIACMIWYGVKCAERGKEEWKMDRRELMYDADGGFILIDVSAGHMGVYEATKPLRHIWKERLQRIPPGLYYLTIADGWIELYSDSMHGVYVIWLDNADSKFFLRTIKQDIPVLVY